jgi:AraC-like DNA-binding protein
MSGMMPHRQGSSFRGESIGGPSSEEALPSPAFSLIMRQLESELLGRVGDDSHWIVKSVIRDLLKSTTSGSPVRSPSEISAKLGCSTRHLYRVFADSGIQLGPLVRWTRLLHALSLKSQRAKDWSSVSAPSGFPTPSSFSHFVKNLTGLSPTEAEKRTQEYWAKRVRKGPFLEGSCRAQAG